MENPLTLIERDQNGTILAFYKPADEQGFQEALKRLDKQLVRRAKRLKQRMKKILRDPRIIEKLELGTDSIPQEPYDYLTMLRFSGAASKAYLKFPQPEGKPDFSLNKIERFLKELCRFSEASEEYVFSSVSFHKEGMIHLVSDKGYPRTMYEGLYNVAIEYGMLEPVLDVGSVEKKEGYSGLFI